jgi:hypothetical protein
MVRKQFSIHTTILLVAFLAIPTVSRANDPTPPPPCSELVDKDGHCPSVGFDGPPTFHGDPKDLNKHYPLRLDDGKDTSMVREITDKLGAPPIKVYDLREFNDAFAVKPIPSMTPVFKEDPEFVGIIINSKHMNENIDTSKKTLDRFEAEYLSEFKKNGGVKRTTERDIYFGRQHRMLLLAHEVAHMLLPSEISQLDLFRGPKSNISKHVQNAYLIEILENLHDRENQSNWDFTNDFYSENSYANELIADYVAGAIFAIMKLDSNTAQDDYIYMWFRDVALNKTHPSFKWRKTVFKAGYDDYSGN